MDFGKTGNIIIEDDPYEGLVLGHAVAIGIYSYARIRDTEVDTSPRSLDTEDSVDAVHGLFRMIELRGAPYEALRAVREGGKVIENALAHAYRADSYLQAIALRAVKQP